MHKSNGEEWSNYYKSEPTSQYLQTLRRSLPNGRDCAYTYLHASLTEARISVHALIQPRHVQGKQEALVRLLRVRPLPAVPRPLYQTTEIPMFDLIEARPARARLIGLGISDPQYLFNPGVNNIFLLIQTTSCSLKISKMAPSLYRSKNPFLMTWASTD
jgi:hypothetical protein